MPPRKVIPLHDADIRREALLRAAARLIAQDGFEALDHAAVCREAAVDQPFLFREFGGLTGLMRALRQEPWFWPRAEELLEEDAEQLRALEPAALMAEFFRRFARALQGRPLTLDVLGWEAVQRTPLTRALEVGRERTALEFFELMETDPPEGVDVTALVAVMAAAMQFLVVKSRRCGVYGGLDLRSPKDWERIDSVLLHLLGAVLNQR